MSPVCYFGAFDLEYPRNQILRHGLARQGTEVVMVNAPRKFPTWRKMPLLASQFIKMADECEVLLLAEFGQSLAVLAWVLARMKRIPLVVDFFTSTYDSAVHDRARSADGSLGARRYWLIDALALRLADVVLVDTQANAEYVTQQFNVARDKLKVIPVGAFVDWFHPEVKPISSKRGGLLIQFYGTYIPLHGIETILYAAKLLQAQDNLHFELLGRGQTYAEMRTLADNLGLSNVTFSQPVSPSELPRWVAGADICLGVFGSTDKAQRVIPNKLYQSLAMRKPVISSDTPALREAFEPGQHLDVVPVSDAEALAEAIGKLADDPDRRRRLAVAGHKRIMERFTPEILGLGLVELMEGLGKKDR